MNIERILERTKHRSTNLIQTCKDEAFFKNMKNIPLLNKNIALLKKHAARFDSEPLPVFDFTLYEEFSLTGKRTNFEKVYFDRRFRLNTYAFMALYTGEEHYIKKLENVIFAICHEYTWALSAHISTEAYKISVYDQNDREYFHNVFAEHYKTIDLFASETAQTLSEILYILGDKLSPFIIHMATKEVFDRVLDPFMEKEHHFEFLRNNWSAVCCGSIGCAGIYFIKDPQTLGKLLTRIIDRLENSYLDSFGEDGACEEGVGYWTYGFSFFVIFAQLLFARTDGEIDLLEGEKVKNIVTFPLKCKFTNCKGVCFSDDTPIHKFRIGIMGFLKNTFNFSCSIAEDEFMTVEEDHCHRWSQFYRDFIWYTPFEQQEEGSSSYLLENAQWFISKYKKDEVTACFAIKGGHNGESHNHNDIGSFMLHINGDNLLDDLGASEYSSEFFGPQRYIKYLAAGSQGHSVPIVNGYYQLHGKEFCAREFTVHESADEDIVTIDMAKAYPDPNLNSLIRTATFDKKNLTLTINDKANFTKNSNSFIQRFVTRNKVVIYSDHVMIGEKNGCHLIIPYDHTLYTVNQYTEGMKSHVENTLEEIVLIDFIVKSNKNENIESSIIIKIP